MLKEQNMNIKQDRSLFAYFKLCKERQPAKQKSKLDQVIQQFQRSSVKGIEHEKNS